MCTIKSQTVEKNNKLFTVNVVLDEDPQSPREWENLGTIYTNKKAFNPDGHTVEEILKDDYEYITDLKSDFKRDNVYFRIDMLDHSGYAFSLASIDKNRNNYAGYYYGFDCGTFGVIAASKKRIREWFQCKRITKDILARVEECLKGEISDFEKYANGYCYGYEVLDENEEFIDGCYGFYDDDEALQEGISIAAAA